MRLSEGQVMDYTKNVAPYMDDRFLSNATQSVEASVTSTISGMTVQLPKGTPPSNKGTFQEEGQQLSDEFVQGESQTIGNCIIPQTIPSFPGSPFAPALPVQQPILPHLYTPPPKAQDVLNEIEDKVRARIEALESVEAGTPVIAQLKWVLETISKAKQQ